MSGRSGAEALAHAAAVAHLLLPALSVIQRMKYYELVRELSDKAFAVQRLRVKFLGINESAKWRPIEAKMFGRAKTSRAAFRPARPHLSVCRANLRD